MSDSTSSPAIGSLFTVLLTVAIIAVGCTAADDGEPSSTQAETTFEATGDADGTRGSDAPTDSTLVYDGRSVPGGLGSFCWNSMCVDGPGVSVPKEKHTLTVSRDSAMEFRFGGKERLTSVEGTAYPIGGGNVVGEMGGGRVLMAAEGNSDLISQDLRVRRRGDETSIPADVPAGEYVVVVFIQVPEGDVSYLFRVMVRE